MSSLFEWCVIQCCDHYGISLPQDPRHFGHWVCHHYLQHMRPSPWEEFLLQNRGDERAVRCSHSFDCLTSCIFSQSRSTKSGLIPKMKTTHRSCALQHPEPDSLKVTAAANTGQRVSSEALKAWKIPSETLTLFGTWCQTIATSPPYHWHIITIVLTYSYLCILETSLGLITEALGYFGAAERIYQSGRSKSFHSKYWTGHEVNSFVVEGFGQRASLTLNHYEWWTDLLDDPAGTSKLARKQRSVIFLTYVFGEWLFEQKCKLCNHGSRCSTHLILFLFRSFQINASTSNDISWYRPWYPMAGSALKAHLWIVEAGRIMENQIMASWVFGWRRAWYIDWFFFVYHWTSKDPGKWKEDTLMNLGIERQAGLKCFTLQVQCSHVNKYKNVNKTYKIRKDSHSVSRKVHYHSLSHGKSVTLFTDHRCNCCFDDLLISISLGR